MSSDTVDVLNDLIKTCNDGLKGFKTAAHDIKREDLRQVLLAGARRCEDGAAELAVLVRALGGEPASGGSAAGALHRGWVEVKSSVMPNTDLAIMEECERGEDSAKKSYKQALEKTLPPEVRVVVERQYSGVLENHNRVHALRDSLREAAHA